MADLIHIALIDDDEAVLDSLALYLARHDVEAARFMRTEDFFAALDRAAQFDCVVSDVRLPGMSGLDLVGRLVGRRFAAPIILITGHGDVDMAVSAIKIGAFDFIEKPFDEVRLLASIRNAVEKRLQNASDAVEIERIQSRFDSLTARQREVMELTVSGLSNREIAARLDISIKTVENHRAWVMERVGARNLADLVRMAMQVRARR